MTFIEKYEKLSKKLSKADISKYTDNFAIQITMDDEDCGGTFFVAYMDGAFRVEPYDYVDSTVNINILASTLEKLVDKKITVDEAFEADAIAAKGNADHVVMLFEGFEKKERKAPAKKSAPKPEKKEEKKPAAPKPEKREEKKPAAPKPEKKEEKKPAAKKTVKKSEPEKKTTKKK